MFRGFVFNLMPRECCVVGNPKDQQLVRSLRVFTEVCCKSENRKKSDAAFLFHFRYFESLRAFSLLAIHGFRHLITAIHVYTL